MFSSVAVSALAAVGAIYLVVLTFNYLRLLFSLFVLPGTSLSQFGGKGSWALITGASDGIGKEYATQLASKGYNVVLVSRTLSKLQAIGRDLASKYHVETRLHAMDFSENKEDDYEGLAKLIKDLDVSILVNNVGQSHSIPVPFLETSQQEMKDIITINCVGTLKITKLVAPGMVKRRRGLILTMASFGGILPTPYLATYSGSKAFLQQWSSALCSELEPSGVRVQLVQSYLVTSAMSKIRKTSMFIPSPKAFVRAALSKIGRSGGAQGIIGTSTPFWSHGIMHWALISLTGTMNATVVNVNRSMHLGIRKRALKKAARDVKKTS